MKSWQSGRATFEGSPSEGRADLRKLVKVKAGVWISCGWRICSVKDGVVADDMTSGVAMFE